MSKTRINQESQEDYLESIYYISLRQPLVRSIDVANDRGVSKASVSQAMHSLKDKGFVYFEKDYSLHLTLAGEEIAKAVYKKHEVITSLLLKLGISEKNARIDACRLEHFISEETFSALKALEEKL